MERDPSPRRGRGGVQRRGEAVVRRLVGARSEAPAFRLLGVLSVSVLRSTSSRWSHVLNAVCVGHRANMELPLCLTRACCAPTAREWNDEMQWLWNSVDALFPEIYQYHLDVPLHNWTRSVGGESGCDCRLRVSGADSAPRRFAQLASRRLCACLQRARRRWAPYRCFHTGTSLRRIRVTASPSSCRLITWMCRSTLWRTRAPRVWCCGAHPKRPVSVLRSPPTSNTSWAPWSRGRFPTGRRAPRHSATDVAVATIGYRHRPTLRPPARASHQT